MSKSSRRLILLTVFLLGIFFVFLWNTGHRGDWKLVVSGSSVTRAVFPDTEHHPFGLEEVTLSYRPGDSSLYLASGQPEKVIQENQGRIWVLVAEPPPFRLETVSDSKNISGPFSVVPNELMMAHCLQRFEFTCDLPNTLLRLESRFRGWIFSKPIYRFSFLPFLSRSGWQRVPTYFGTRELTLKTKEGKILATFARRYWNQTEIEVASQWVSFEPNRRWFFLFGSAFPYFEPFFIVSTGSE